MAGFLVYYFSKLLNLTRALFAISFPCKRLFSPALLARLQIKRMPFDFLNDIFLLHLALKSAQGTF